MNYFGLMLYQSLILFASSWYGFGQEFEYELKLEEVIIDGMRDVGATEDKIWEWVNICKYNIRDKFFFRNDELDRICGGKFSSSDVEIIEVLERVVRFSLIRGPNHLFVNMLFAAQSSVPLFFGDMRSQHKSDCGRIFKVEKLIEYRIVYPDRRVPRLKLLGNPVAIFFKNLNSNSATRPKTINFAEYKTTCRSEGVLLVTEAKSFNIVRIMNTNMYLFCSSNILTHKFFLIFGNALSARTFFAKSSVESCLNYELPCPTDWVNDQMITRLNFV